MVKEFREVLNREWQLIALIVVMCGGSTAGITTLISPTSELANRVLALEVSNNAIDGKLDKILLNQAIEVELKKRLRPDPWSGSMATELQMHWLALFEEKGMHIAHSELPSIEEIQARHSPELQ